MKLIRDTAHQPRQYFTSCVQRPSHNHGKGHSEIFSPPRAPQSLSFLTLSSSSALCPTFLSQSTMFVLTEAKDFFKIILWFTNQWENVNVGIEGKIK